MSEQELQVLRLRWAVTHLTMAQLYDRLNASYAAQFQRDAHARVLAMIVRHT